MSSTTLLNPILEGGIKHTHFFNGRFLSGEDMQAQQEAQHQHQAQLGRAVGEGVVNGFQVTVKDDGGTSGTPTLTITKGMAVNRAGQVLELPNNTDLILVKHLPDSNAAAGNGVFADCDGLPDNGMIPTGTGVYVLTTAPAKGYKGKAPMHRLEDDGTISACNHRYEIEGIQFRLVYMDVTNSDVAQGTIGNAVRFLLMQPGDTGRARLRNLLAHLCFGTEEAASFYDHLLADPISSAARQSYGPMDVLRENHCLKDIDVPLALVVWTKNGLEFIDMWSVRRSLHSHFIEEKSTFAVTSRRKAELEAGYMQFQAQLKAIIKSTGNSGGIKASDYFRFLPAVGIVPLPQGETGKEFNEISFFQDLTYRNPVFIEGYKLRGLLDESFLFDPIDLEIPRDTQSKELVWLYRVRQNYEAMEKQAEQGGNSATAYLVFSSGYIPFRGEAQYNLSRWEYSNYGPGIAGGTILG